MDKDQTADIAAAGLCAQGEEENVVALLKHLSNSLAVFADAALKEFDITYSQARIMMFLVEQGGEVTQKELEEYLKVSRQTVIGMVSRLEKKGYVESRIDKDRHGKKTVMISEWARKRGEDMDSNRWKFEHLLLKGFEEEEIERLKEYLRRMHTNLDNGGIEDIK
ncbi:MAG: MarR family transcriptional regulator [Lachnospiraceae bacterium]|nr:MarR family transcriptional regulator [Lachnospiraceae bacterium]